MYILKRLIVGTIVMSFLAGGVYSVFYFPEILGTIIVVTFIYSLGSIVVGEDE